MFLSLKAQPQVLIAPCTNVWFWNFYLACTMIPVNTATVAQSEVPKTLLLAIELLLNKKNGGEG